MNEAERKQFLDLNERMIRGRRRVIVVGVFFLIVSTVALAFHFTEGNGWWIVSAVNTGLWTALISYNAYLWGALSGVGRIVEDAVLDGQSGSIPPE